MHQRLSRRARSVVLAAQAEARRRNRSCVDPEHILLALISDSTGVAVAVLANLQIHPSNIAMEIERQTCWGAERPAASQIALSAAAENAVKLADEESRVFNSYYIGTEHLLLGLLREKESLAARVLQARGLTVEAIRVQVQNTLSESLFHVESRQSFRRHPELLIEGQQEFFLSIYRSAVGHYQPKIERRTGVSLGEIAVWNYSCLHEHAFAQYARSTTPWIPGIIKAFLFRRRFQRYAHELKEWYAAHASKCIASYYRSAIYVSFGANVPHEDMVASTVVHELSHALWERLAGEDLHRQWSQNDERLKLFVEGFAVYAERVWFLDLYPPDMRGMFQYEQMDPHSIHARGFKKVEPLVQKHGTQILFELPKRWPEL